MIQWGKYINRAYLLCSTLEEHKARMPSAVSELERIGLVSSGLLEFRYSTCTLWDRLVHSEFAKANPGKDPPFQWFPAWYTTVGRVTNDILVDAMGHGYERVLILENDVRFLKDLSLVDAALSELPDDAGIARLDWWRVGRLATEDEFGAGEEPWVRQTFRASGGACYMVGGNGLREYSRTLSEVLPGPGDLAINYVNCGKYVSRRHLAIQKRFECSGRRVRPGFEAYAKMDMSAYAD